MMPELEEGCENHVFHEHVGYDNRWCVTGWRIPYDDGAEIVVHDLIADHRIVETKLVVRGDVKSEFERVVERWKLK
jgi:metallophosphoesterase superfamily enzyme